MFAPVPWGQPWSYDDTYCVSDCIPAVGIDERGDDWLLGCSRHFSDMPCTLGYYQPVPLCGIDPLEGNTFWYTPRGTTPVL